MEKMQLLVVIKKWTLLTLQPHMRRLQIVITFWQIIPAKVVLRVKFGGGTSLKPESANVHHCTVFWRLVVVAVVGAERCTVAVAERVVASVTRVTSHPQPVVVRLAVYQERAVLGVVPAAIATCLQVDSQLEAVICRELMEQFVAEPVVASGAVETDFELRPRTIEKVGPVKVLLYQQRNAVVYNIGNIIVTLTVTGFLNGKMGDFDPSQSQHP